MLTEVKAYSSWPSAPTLLLNDNGRAETDLIQVRNIDGLDPVKASVNTSPRASIDGTVYTGASIDSRNIVLTLHPNPDWDNWSFESLRRLLYSYFMPKRPVRLVFHSDDLPPVEISGVVESAEANPFSKDVEVAVSIICPDPYFTSVDPIVLTGQSIRSGGDPITFEYNGSVETGCLVRVTEVSGTPPTVIQIQMGDPAVTYFIVDASVDVTKYLDMNSIPMQKFIQNVSIGTGVITNLLAHAHIDEGSEWPIIRPGDNEFSVITDNGIQDWQLTYFERYGGL